MVALVPLTFQFRFCLLDSSQLELGILLDQTVGRGWRGEDVEDMNGRQLHKAFLKERILIASPLFSQQ